jgi:hypothetical protein
LSVQEGIDLKVLYALVPNEKEQGAGFGVPFSWDIPMLEGYKWELLPNSRKEPNLRGFWGSSNPKIFSVLRKEKPDAVVITGWQSLPLLQTLSACVTLRIPRIIERASFTARLGENHT